MSAIDTCAAHARTLADIEADVLALLAAEDKTESDYDRLFALVKEIDNAEPVTPVDVAVKLRRILCPVIGLPAGGRGKTDIASLTQVLALVERQPRPADTTDAALFAIQAEREVLAAQVTAMASADPAFPALKARLHHLDQEVFPATPAHTLSGIILKAHQLADALADSEETWGAAVARGLRADLERLGGTFVPTPAGDADLVKLAEEIAAREKAAGAKGVSEEETSRFVVEITGLYGALATTPAAGLVGVEAKLSQVLYFMLENKNVEECVDAAHDVEAVRTSLDTIRRMIAGGMPANDSELLAILAEIDRLTPIFDEATVEDPAVTARLRHLHNEALPACPARTMAGVQAKLARAESILAGSAADWSAQMVRSAMGDLGRMGTLSLAGAA